MCLWKKMTMHLFSSKPHYTNKLSIPKLREDSLFHMFNITHTHITDDQLTFTVIEKQRKTNDQLCVYGKR